jgi:hypothetical protein
MKWNYLERTVRGEIEILGPKNFKVIPVRVAYVPSEMHTTATPKCKPRKLHLHHTVHGTQVVS